MQFTQSRQFSGQADPVLDVISTDYKLFVLQVGTGVDVDYVILSETGAQWEAGTGQLAVGGAITRDTVTDNSLGTTAKIDFDVGRHLIVVLEKVTATVGAIDAIDVTYDNATSGLAATDVQAAIDELAASGGGASALILDIGYAGSDTTTTLSSDLRTATCGGSSSGSLPSSYPVGGVGTKIYWEVECITIPAGAGSKMAFGVETRINLLNSTRSGAYPGSSVGSWGYWNSGLYYSNSGSSGTPATLASGDIGQVALDCATGKLWFGKNNTWQSGGDPAAGASAVFTVANRLIHQVHAVVCPYVAGAVIRLRRASENSYSPPSGFVAAFD